jgi:hypothetical protein
MKNFKLGNTNWRGVFKLRNIIIAVIIFILMLGGACAYWRHRANNQYPANYPYGCSFNNNNAPTNCFSGTESEGKVLVARRPEVKVLVQQYGRKGVVIKALEFKDIQDKVFLHSLLGNNYVDLGCIIEVTYPGGRYVYLENDGLDVIQRLNGDQFDRWLRTAPLVDVQKYYSHLH